MRNEDYLSLRECPFCGGEAERLTRTSLYRFQEYTGRRAILCMNCGVIMFGRTEQAAADLWNRRVNDEG